MAQIVSITSKLVFFHANDILDQRIISKGSLSPVISYQSVSKSLLEIVEMMQWTIQNKGLKIRFDDRSDSKAAHYFDKTRLQ